MKWDNRYPLWKIDDMYRSERFLMLCLFLDALDIKSVRIFLPLGVNLAMARRADSGAI